MQLDETTPSTLQRQIVERRQRFYSSIAAKKVQDQPIDLRRNRKYPPQTESFSIVPIDYYPPSYWSMTCEWQFAVPYLKNSTNPISPTWEEPMEVLFKIKEIQRAVCTVYNISFNDLISARRVATLVEPRHVAIMLVNHLTKLSMPEIGRRFGGRDHTTILYAIRKLDFILPEVIKNVQTDATPIQWVYVAKNVFDRSVLKKKKFP
jgi:hypothetical protein